MQSASRSGVREMTVPPRLIAFADAIGARLELSSAGWTAELAFTGCWPIPSRDVSFGKGSSCIIGIDVPVSCAEVELTTRARSAGWVGGWMSGYNPADRRFPGAWRNALITEPMARQLVATEFPRVNFPRSGIPDLIVARHGLVVAAECKRRSGHYFDNDCVTKPGGDALRPSQQQWTSDALMAGIPSDVLVTVWWQRLEASPCR